MILSTIKVVDLWWLTKADFSLTFENLDRYSYHPSNSLTIGVVDLWSYQQSKSLTCNDSPRRISSWLLELWIDDPIHHQSRWLVMTRQAIYPWHLELCFDDLGHPFKSLICGDSPRDLSLTFGIMFRWSWTSVQVVDLWWLAKGVFTWLLEMLIYDPINHQSRWLVITRQGIYPW
jgi:hypothetical protein